MFRLFILLIPVVVSFLLALNYFFTEEQKVFVCSIFGFSFVFGFAIAKAHTIIKKYII